MKLNLKILLGLLTLFFLPLLLTHCKDDESPKQTGTLRFQMINPISQPYRMKKANPDLTGTETVTKTISFNVCVGDVWVSKHEVKEGEEDVPEDWVRLTSFTNRDHKLFEDYSFPDVEIPIGEYKSVHLTFRNVFYRYAVLESDSSVFYELLETMGSWGDSCNWNDTSWVDPNSNYFSLAGNHRLVGGRYILEVPDEKLTGFTIDANKIAVVSWRLGAGATEPCTTTLHDVNNNRTWDCGTDSMSFYCPPEVKAMWDFVVEYQ
ncbi:MAG: hypothetical protein H6608_03445 [Flavobacteriales bacterium]|nr:hypothetical protein [Bacteroidota bacterium]MCB9240160.1 hypothetical protein [Flavobacteriales bacterium]